MIVKGRGSIIIIIVIASKMSAVDGKVVLDSIHNGPMLTYGFRSNR